MDVRIDETWDEGLARPVDLPEAHRQPLSHVKDACEAPVADDDRAAVLDWTAAPIPDPDIEEHQRLVNRNAHDAVKGVCIPSHEPVRHHPIGDP